MKASVRNYSGSPFIALLFALAALFMTQTAMADGGVAMENINRIHNPSLSTMELPAVTTPVRREAARDVAEENIAAMFDPRIRSERMRSTSTPFSAPRDASRDVALDNLRRIFKVGNM
ncbi:hypothetical protein GCM10011352_30150 [Marinobacterium zhoushanense]|uniref:Uncharacterized protein n=1 Tax=Marinobacterium zhoushanense TaxID=1679163 RepID=A0ABQ1KN27_9GAMM|nr:hypothetical protein [Marinobacterium zhoushanense]GGC01948.1 hypothetical protein GCM10011352_30150 [Marinobacterium zhoushanense]